MKNGREQSPKGGKGKGSSFSKKEAPPNFGRAASPSSPRPKGGGSKGGGNVPVITLKNGKEEEGAAAAPSPGPAAAPSTENIGFRAAGQAVMASVLMADAPAASDDDSIKVFCRFRPLNAAEKQGGGGCCADFGDATSTVKVSGNPFSFDRVFRMDSTQKEVFDGVAKPIVDSVLRGFNGTVFAYGQTSSGKTHTMEGDIADEDRQGLIPRIVSGIFDGIYGADASTEFVVRVSMFEIYNETLKDLLNPLQTNLKIREDQAHGVFIEDLTELSMGCEDEVIEEMLRGNENRSVGFTNMNAHSSRSHLVFKIGVEQKSLHTKSVKKGQLHLVDLAGSETVAKTGASGKRLDEAKNINASLSALGNVINSLTDRNKSHVPYRDSKLTRVLQESLGGNAKTSIIIACSPSPANMNETLSTLRFGQRAKNIKNRAQVNVELSVDELKLVIAKKDSELAAAHQRVAHFEKLLKEKNIPVPSTTAITAVGSTGGSPARADMTAEVFDEVQRLREKLQDSAENITELSRLKEACEDEKQDLLERLEKLRRDKETAQADLVQKDEKLEGLTKAFHMLQQHSDQGLTEDCRARLSSSASAKSDGSNASKLAAMEKDVASLTSMYEILINQKHKAEADSRTWRTKYDNMMTMVSQLYDVMMSKSLLPAGDAPANSGMNFGRVKSSIPSMMEQRRKSVAMKRERSMTYSAAVNARKSVIVKSLRGGLSFRHADDEE